MGKLRVAVVTDIHYGFDVGNKLGSKAPRLMDHFAKAVNKYKPDCVVDMGDRISCRNRDMDMGYLRQVKDHFNAIAAPVHHVIGNHDAKFMSRADNESITGSPGTSYAKDYNGYRLVFWNPNVTIASREGLRLTDDDLNWLRTELKNSDKPVVLFSHVPLDNDPKDYEEEVKEFSGIAGRFYYAQGHEVRKILEESEKVILCMAGHRHTKRHREINGIHYITQQAMTSSWHGTKRPTGAHSFLEIDNGTINVQMRGTDTKGFTLTAKPFPG